MNSARPANFRHRKEISPGKRLQLFSAQKARA
jgi:hypothetical protein